MGLNFFVVFAVFAVRVAICEKFNPGTLWAINCCVTAENGCRTASVAFQALL